MNKKSLNLLDKDKSIHKNNYLTGFTLLEVTVSIIILSIVISGLVNVFISGKRWILHSRSRMTAGELGKYFLDPLQMQVRQDIWNTTSCLGTGNLTNCPNQTAGTGQGLDRNYTAYYNVTPGSPLSNITKVKVNITWNETSP